MRKNFLASIAISFIIASGVLTPLFVFAQEAGPQQDTTGAYNYNPVQPSGTFGDSSGNDKDITTKDICTGDTSGFTCALMSGISEVIMFVPLKLATVSAMVFDFSIWNSIQSGTYTKYDTYDTANDSEGLVILGWKLVRDFTNLIFIFALFVIAFTLIFDLDGGDKVTMISNPKRTFARVLVMALLINFSFFLGRVVIDFSNKMAQEFYSKMDKAPDMTTENSGSDVSDVQSFYQAAPGVHSVATRIIAQINPQNFLLSSSTVTEDGMGGGSGKYANMFFLSLVAACFGVFLIYIFLSIAILFISRTVGLFLGIIISPLAFASYTVPMLQRQPYLGFDDWMKQFLGLAFMAPIFMFFLYVSIQFFEIPMAAGAGNVSTAATILFKFAMVAMFLTIAKRMSKDMSGKLGDMATGAVTGIVTGVATIGAAAATGGTSAALLATRQQAARGATAVSNKVLGNERTTAIQQRLGGLRNFRNLSGSTRNSVAGLAGALTGSRVPGQINNAWDQGKLLGQKVNRVDSVNNARQARLTKEAADKKRAEYAVEAEAKKQAVRSTYNYDQRKAAMDVKNSTSGPKPTFGDGSARMKESDFSKTQQERILDKAIASEEKRKANGASTTPTQPVTPPPVNPQTKTVVSDDSRKATNVFNGNANFDRPQESSKSSGLVDQYGNPISSATSTNAAQKAESEKLTSIYNQEKRTEEETIHVDNLAVKNLKLETSTPTIIPARQMTPIPKPQEHATNLLSKIQAVPLSGSNALNYKATDFATKTSITDSTSKEISEEKKKFHAFHPETDTPMKYDARPGENLFEHNIGSNEVMPIEDGYQYIKGMGKVGVKDYYGQAFNGFSVIQKDTKFSDLSITPAKVDVNGKIIEKGNIDLKK